MSEQVKKNDKESMLVLTSKPTQIFFVYCIQSKDNFFFFFFFFTEKELFKRKKYSGRLNKRRKGF